MEVKPIRRLHKEVIEGFRSIGTSIIGDLMDQVGLHGVVSGLRAVKEGSVLVGPAITVKEVSGLVNSYPVEDFPISKIIDVAEAGDVLVFDNGGKEISTWGGLASTAAQLKGIAGVVIDGACRDAEDIARLDFPVFSRHITPTTGKTRIKVLEVNGVIQCGGVRVWPGDIIVADRTGVVVVPQDRTSEILEKAKQVAKEEDRFIHGLREGKSFGEMQKKTGQL